MDWEKEDVLEDSAGIFYAVKKQWEEHPLHIFLCSQALLAASPPEHRQEN